VKPPSAPANICKAPLYSVSAVKFSLQLKSRGEHQRGALLPRSCILTSRRAVFLSIETPSSWGQASTRNSFILLHHCAFFLQFKLHQVGGGQQPESSPCDGKTVNGHIRPSPNQVIKNIGSVTKCDSELSQNVIYASFDGNWNTRFHLQNVIFL